MENTTNNTVFWTMEEVNLLKFRESDSLCWFFAKKIIAENRRWESFKCCLINRIFDSRSFN